MHPATATPQITATATATTAKTRRCRRRHRDRRPCSLLFASKDSTEPAGQEGDEPLQPPPPPPGSSAQDENTETETDTDPRERLITPPSSSDVVTAAPEPTRGEQTPATAATAAAAAAGTVDSNADGDEEQATPSQVSNSDGPAEEGGEPEVDWDKAWASTRQKMEKDAQQMEKDRKAAPAFSGRKQVVATRNSDGDYEFEEISNDGSRRRRGKGGSGGFGFADGNQAGTDGRGRIQDQEQEAVNLATTNKVGVGSTMLPRNAVGKGAQGM